MLKSFGYYVHIPFCRRACNYCNFHFSINLSTKDRFIKALITEIKIRASNNLPISSIYFGGGTPSILCYKDIGKILEAIVAYNKVSNNAELTIECNPEDLDLEKLKSYKLLGFNRLSFGIQTFDNNVLKYINRGHDKFAAINSVLDARKAGFENISIDLIYAIPTSSNTRIHDDLKVLSDLKPNHISAYCLSIEKKTVFHYWKSKGILKEFDDDLAFEEYNFIQNFLNSIGYIHYEVSSYCLPNNESRHNINYWNSKLGYIGVGPSAHSYDGLTRSFNIANNHLYIKALESGTINNQIEYLTPKDRINEYIMTSLRTNKGLDLNVLKKDYNYEIVDNIVWDYFNGLIRDKILLFHDGILIPSSRGMFLADGIAEKIFLS